MRTLLPLLAFASLAITPIPEPVPTMVPYEAPPFDTAAVAAAVLRIEAWPGTEKASLGSGVLIREDGLVVTAYHVVQDCIRRLRTDEKTRGYLGSDGSYDGARGALPCEGYRATFVSCGDGVGCPASDRVYLAAAPPVAVGTPPLFAYLDGLPRPENRVARSDYALVRVDACGRTPLVLSNRTPAMGERIWVAGVAGDVLAPFAESATEALASNVLLFDLKAKLARILAEGVLSRAHGVELARKVAPSLGKTRKSDARVEAVEDDIRRVADGQVEAVASEVILEWAATMQRIADEAQPDQRDLDRLGAVLDVLRESARRPEGERVAKILRTFASHRAEVSTGEQWELHGDLVQDDDGASWCGLRAFSGRVASSDELIVLDSFIAKGMSGGPVIDANGQVLGVISGYLSTTTAVFRPANVSAARPRTPLPITAATVDQDPETSNTE